MAYRRILLVSRRDAISALSALTALSALSVALFVGVPLAHAQPAQSVSIVEPANGATVSSPFKLRFAVRGMAVAPAGEIVANSGHHHLLINVEPIAAGTPVPTDDKHIHFGKGQTETEVTLPPGTYKLTAQFANGAHQSFGPAMSQTIKVTVR